MPKYEEKRILLLACGIFRNPWTIYTFPFWYQQCLYCSLYANLSNRAMISWICHGHVTSVRKKYGIKSQRILKLFITVELLILSQLIKQLTWLFPSLTSLYISMYLYVIRNIILWFTNSLILTVHNVIVISDVQLLERI